MRALSGQARQRMYCSMAEGNPAASEFAPKMNDLLSSILLQYLHYQLKLALTVIYSPGDHVDLLGGFKNLEIANKILTKIHLFGFSEQSGKKIYLNKAHN